jgi:hypothetical protein
MTSAGEAQNATLKKQGVQPCDQLHVAGEKILDLLENSILQLTSKLSGILIQHL